MSGAGFFAATTSPASTVNRFAVGSPTTWISTASTDGLAEVDATANFQPAERAASAILLIPDRGGIAPDDLLVNARLLFVPGGDKSFAIFLAFRNGDRLLKLLFQKQSGHPFLATSDFKLFSVLLGRPLPGNTELLPHLIKGREMSVEFRVRQHTVTVENQASLHTLSRSPRAAEGLHEPLRHLHQIPVNCLLEFHRVVFLRFCL